MEQKVHEENKVGGEVGSDAEDGTYIKQVVMEGSRDTEDAGGSQVETWRRSVWWKTWKTRLLGKFETLPHSHAFILESHERTCPTSMPFIFICSTHQSLAPFSSNTLDLQLLSEVFSWAPGSPLGTKN